MIAWIALGLAAAALMLIVAALVAVGWVLRRPQLVLGAVAGAVMPPAVDTGALLAAAGAYDTYPAPSTSEE